MLSAINTMAGGFRKIPKTVYRQKGVNYMNEVQLFDFQDHNVITIIVNSEPYFLFTDVAKVLEYKNIWDAKKFTYKESRISLSRKDTRDSRGPKIWKNPNDYTKKTFISKEGVFDLIQHSNAPQAKKFNYWINHTVLPTLYETGSYSIQSNTELSKQVTFHQKDIEKLTSRLDDLENNMVINTREAGKLQQAGRRKVVPLLGGKNTRTYKKYRNKAFSDLWVSFKDYFVLASYKDLPRKRLQEGMNFIETWQPRLKLQGEINTFNDQMDLF